MRLFSTPKRPFLLLDPPSLLCSGYRIFFIGVKPAGEFSLYGFMTSQGTLYLFILTASLAVNVTVNRGESLRGETMLVTVWFEVDAVSPYTDVGSQ
jgi:hypothetical protein